MARQRRAIRCDGQKYRAQTVHAWLGAALKIIGYYEENPYALADLVPKALSGRLGALQLLAARQQMIAIACRPSIVLSVGEFDIVGPHFLSHAQYLLHMVYVEPVQHDVEHHRVVVFLDQLRDFRLEFESARTAQEVVHFAGAVLERQLNVIETCTLQRLQACFGQSDAGRDQIDIEAQRMCFGNDEFQIIAHQRLAAGQLQLLRAERPRLAQYAYPVFGSEFCSCAREIDRVVAKHTVQRALSVSYTHLTLP